MNIANISQLCKRTKKKTHGFVCNQHYSNTEIPERTLFSRILVSLPKVASILISYVSVRARSVKMNRALPLVPAWAKNLLL